MSLRGEWLVVEWQREPTPNIRECPGELIDQNVVMPGGRRNSQALGTHRHRRIIDRLNVDAVSAQQQVACCLTLLRIADHHRDDVCVAHHDWERRGTEYALYTGGTLLMPVALPL